MSILKPLISFLKNNSRTPIQQEKGISNNAPIKQTVSRCRALLQEGRLAEAEKLAQAQLPKYFYHRGILTMLHHIASAYFQYDVAYHHAEQAWYAGDANAFHAKLLLQAATRIATPLTGELKSEILPYISDSMLLSRLNQIDQANKALLPFGGDDFLRNAAPARIVQVLEQLHKTEPFVTHIDRLLRAVYLNRHVGVLDYAVPFLASTLASYGYLHYTAWLYSDYGREGTWRTSVYGRMLAMVGQFERAMEYAVRGRDKLLLSLLEQGSEQGSLQDHSKLIPFVDNEYPQSGVLKNRRQSLALLHSQKLTEDDFLSTFPLVDADQPTAHKAEVLDHYIHAPWRHSNGHSNKLKIAVCISGQFRSPEKAAQRLHETLEDFDADYFVATWDKTPEVVNLNKSIYRNIPSVIIKNLSEPYKTREMFTRIFSSISVLSETNRCVTREDVYKVYPVKTHTIFKEDLFIQNIALTNLREFPSNQLKMFYLIYQCHRIMLQYSIITKKSYDIVIRIRPDFIIGRENPFTLEAFKEILSLSYKKENNNYYWIKVLNYIFGHKLIGISDQFAFGNEHSMRVYTSAWLYMRFFEAIAYKEGMSGQMMEYLMLEHYFQHGGSVKQMPLEANGQLSQLHLSAERLLSDFSDFCFTPERLYSAEFPKRELTALWEGIQELCVQEMVMIEPSHKERIEAAISSLNM